MADQSSALMVVGGAEGECVREYRKGNWTLNETLVLITAKKMDDERRMKKESGGGEVRSTRPAELRWKWVEDYCWRNGCMRSQNQCNDKWDNLMRDYKKVRDHEKKAEEGTQEGSYWKLERHERKDKNLPTNLLPEIYEALVEVVERRGTQRVRLHGPHPNKGGFDPLEKTISSFPSSLPSLQHHSSHPAPSQPPPQPAQSLPSLAQILMEVSFQTHLQREGEREEKEAATLVLLMNLALQSPRVPLFYPKHFFNVKRRKIEGIKSL